MRQRRALVRVELKLARKLKFLLAHQGKLHYYWCQLLRVSDE
jgi:hypothetical protein